jgi:electron transfer flavoprotein beta subunit
VERESPDLVIFGQQASDSDGAVMWSAVADRLRMPVVSQISELEVANGQITAKRQTEFGYDTIAAPLPCVLGVADSLNEPRYPSLKGIMGAKKKPQDVVSLADVGVDADRAGEAGSRTSVLSLSPPPSRGDTVKIEDDGTAAQKIFEFLVERKFV